MKKIFSKLRLGTNASGNRIWLYPLLLILLAGCKKDFLDTRPNKALLVPTTVADMQTLLDNLQVFNNTPGLPFIADGDFYTPDAGYNAFGLDMERNSYTWAKNIYGGIPDADWNNSYQQIFYANVVLEGLAKLPTASTTAEKNAVAGTALFARAFALYNLVRVYAKPYDPTTAATDAGVPLRLQADVTLKVARGTVAQVYAQVFTDLSAARKLLPAGTAYKSRPTVAAVQALRARICLTKEEYVQAGLYADSALALSKTLIDYSTLSQTANRPFPRVLPDANDEVIFYSAQIAYSFNTTSAPSYADSLLYRSYKANDLRKVIFFRLLTPGNYKFKGNYAGSLLLFSGLAVDEMYLIRAECAARAGNTAAAMEALNTMLVTRWVTGTYAPLAASGAEDALRQVLMERRKQLLGRGIRWDDLRRLNTDPRFKVTLNRNVGGNGYSLGPGSPRYTYPIPDEEIRLNGLTQNER
ncbi:RagB/SusD family nutrient uptake outer membrane protein [Mucilaginibacter sp. RCC_168]|uniref:RagB/SusD family nutrient uptake outer membrane protein n=1 Tax=Mucilaginibacter sp. RCC_168 TaxID=3239221 RepID=UPI0035256910